MQGDAFGGRMFIVCTPIFAVGLGYLIDWMDSYVSKYLIYAAGSLLLAWNLLLFIEYRFDLVLRAAPPTWYDLTVRRVSLCFSGLRLVDRDE